MAAPNHSEISIAILTGKSATIAPAVEKSGKDPRILVDLYKIAEAERVTEPLDQILEPAVFSGFALELHADPRTTATTLTDLMQLRFQRPGTILLSTEERLIQVKGEAIIDAMERAEYDLVQDTSYSEAFGQAFKEIVRD